AVNIGNNIDHFTQTFPLARKIVPNEVFSDIFTFVVIDISVTHLALSLNSKMKKSPKIQKFTGFIWAGFSKYAQGDRKRFLPENNRLLPSPLLVSSFLSFLEEFFSFNYAVLTSISSICWLLLTLKLFYLYAILRL
ncbi:MAG: hypothetical protein MRZ52_03310, partial [Oscillospiraceae bacterium]|nr:hypothetical protein [Oscillospiraceae bacterium]